MKGRSEKEDEKEEEQGQSAEKSGLLCGVAYVRGAGAAGRREITPWSRCDKTGRVSARAVFTCLQIGTNLSTYRVFRFHRAYRYFFTERRGGKREIPAERRGRAYPIRNIPE